MATNGTKEAIMWIKKSLDKHEALIEKQGLKLDKILDFLNKEKLETIKIKKDLRYHIENHPQLIEEEIEKKEKEKRFEMYKIVGLTGTIIGIIFTAVNFIIKLFM